MSDDDKCWENWDRVKGIIWLFFMGSLVKALVRGDKCVWRKWVNHAAVPGKSIIGQRCGEYQVLELETWLMGLQNFKGTDETGTEWRRERLKVKWERFKR